MKKAKQQKRIFPSFGRFAVWSTALFYAPLAATYFLHPDPTIYNLQDYILEKLVSPSFAFGNGSGYLDGHVFTFKNTWITMLLHSLTGSAALLMGLAQFSNSFRRKYPKTHRFIGYIYLSCSLLIPASAVNYLIKTGPQKIFSGPAFALILWLLAFGTFISGVLALQSAISLKFERHRDIMAVNYAMMLSAPLLRIGWILIPTFWNETKEMINLTEGIWAGPFLLSCVTYYIRSANGERKQTRKQYVSRFTIMTTLFISLATSVALVKKIVDTKIWFRPQALFWWSVPLFVLQFSVFIILYIQAKRRQDRIADQYWLINILSLSLIPVMAALNFYITKQFLNADEPMAWYGAIVGGWSLTNVFGTMTNIYLTKYAKDAVTSRKTLVE